jgi:hypothetical protein
LWAASVVQIVVTRGHCHGKLKLPHKNEPTTTAHLYSQIFTQMSQWINLIERRHLQGYAEDVSAIFQSGIGCPSHWLTYLSHWDFVMLAAMLEIYF